MTATPETPDVRPSTPDRAATEGLAPLPGEAGIPNVAQRRRTRISRKGLLAAGLMLLSLVAVSAFSLQRFARGGHSSDEPDAKAVADRPTASTGEARRLELPAIPPTPAASAVPVPALVPTPQEQAEVAPIGVRRTGKAAPTTTGPATPAPEDAPVLLVSTRPNAQGATPRAASRQTGAVNGPSSDPDDGQDTSTPNLEGYQRQLQGLLDTLTHTTGQVTQGNAAGPGSGPHDRASGRTATTRIAAGTLGQRSLTLPKGTAFTCALKTKIISAASGLVGCQVQRHVYSDDGRVLLIERGSHLDGEYQMASVRPGTVRIPVLWTRIRTPHGVTVDIDSPGTGALGEAGIDGHVDNRWGERLGAAMLLSLIDDSVKLVIQNQASRDNPGQGDTIVLPSTTANTSKLAEKVLESTINIPPLIYQNQGGIVGIYVAHDIDFSGVYELRPQGRAPAAEEATTR